MAEKTEITISGAGTFGELQPGWSINEDATPVAIGDSSGAIDSASLTLSQGEDSEFLLSEAAEIQHDRLGTFLGSISTASSNGAGESTDTNIPMSIAGIGRTLSSERTAQMQIGYNLLPAGKVLGGTATTSQATTLIATATFLGDQSTRGQVYRIESAPSSGVQVVRYSPDGSKYSWLLSGSVLPTNASSVYSFLVTPDRFILFYLSGGVPKLGFFDRTTTGSGGSLITSIGTIGSGNSQFSNTIFAAGTHLYFSGTENAVGEVYVADYGNNRVQRFHPTTAAFIGAFGVPQPAHITGSPFSRGSGVLGGNVYVHSQNTSVDQFLMEYATDGTPTGRTIDTGSQISSIAMTFGAGSGILVSFGNTISLYDRLTGRFLNSNSVAAGISLAKIATGTDVTYVSSTSGSIGDIYMFSGEGTSTYAGFAYYAALGGIESIAYTAPLTGYTLPAWTDSPWNKIKELAAAVNLEVAVVGGVFTVRAIGTRVLDLDSVQGGSVSLGLSSQQGARAVNISYSGLLAQNSDFTLYKMPYYQYINFSTGSETEIAVPVVGQAAVAWQPIYNENYRVMAIRGSDGAAFPLTRKEWEDSGASLSVSIDPARPSFVNVKIVAPTLPYYWAGVGAAWETTNFRLGGDFPLDRETSVAVNLVANPGGFTGLNWATGTGLSAVYAPFTPPVWTVTGGGNEYATLNIDSVLYAGVSYRARIELTAVSGSISSIGIIQAGGLPFASIGSMALSGGVWRWEGVIVPSATTTSTPQLWFAVTGATGAKLTLASYVMMQLGGDNLGPSFDGGGGPGGYEYRWLGTAFNSASQKYFRIRNANNLEIYGRGLRNDNTGGVGSIELLTGADAQVVGAEKSSDVNNVFISTISQAYDRGIWRAEQLNGVSMQLSATVPTSALNGFGLTAGSLVTFKECIYRITSARIGYAWTSLTATRYTKQSDTQALHSGKTMGQVDAAWAGTKYKDQIIKPLRPIV